ncbi:MAG TPA: hypothetical protein VFN78_04070 [Ktedonobacterales bacterium]|nr:hypothetical protein [Ktedonobacterales bacterium]
MDEVRVFLEHGIPCELDVFHLLKVAEMPIGRQGIREGPEMLVGLRLGRVGERSLLSGDGAWVFETQFEDWLAQFATQS